MEIINNDNKYIAFSFEDSLAFSEFCHSANLNGYNIIETFTPKPVAQMISGKRSRAFSMTVFAVSIFAMVSAISFIYWTSASHYPIRTGGQPFFSLAFSLPVIFAFTILITALATMMFFIFSRKGKAGIALSSDFDDKYAVIVEQIKSRSNSEATF